MVPRRPPPPFGPRLWSTVPRRACGRLWVLSAITSAWMETGRSSEILPATPSTIPLSSVLPLDCGRSGDLPGSTSGLMAIFRSPGRRNHSFRSLVFPKGFPQSFQSRRTVAIGQAGFNKYQFVLLPGGNLHGPAKFFLRSDPDSDGIRIIIKYPGQT